MQLGATLELVHSGGAAPCCSSWCAQALGLRGRKSSRRLELGSSSHSRSSLVARGRVDKTCGSLETGGRASSARWHATRGGSVGGSRGAWGRALCVRAALCACALCVHAACAGANRWPERTPRHPHGKSLSPEAVLKCWEGKGVAIDARRWWCNALLKAESWRSHESGWAVSSCRSCWARPSSAMGGLLLWMPVRARARFVCASLATAAATGHARVCSPAPVPPS